MNNSIFRTRVPVSMNQFRTKLQFTVMKQNQIFQRLTQHNASVTAQVFLVVVKETKELPELL